MLFMEEKLPDNLEEALEYIQKLHSENAKLKETVDKQNIMLSNLNEMLVKGRKAMALRKNLCKNENCSKKQCLAEQSFGLLHFLQYTKDTAFCQGASPIIRM